MLNKIIGVFKKEYQTLNLIEVSKSNLLRNYNYLSSFDKKIKIAPVIKSNAYGHGILEVAKILDSVNVPFFCVDSLYEAYELLKVNVKTPILIMGYTDPQNFKVKKLPFSFTVYDLELARVLNKYQPGCGIHIFVDTGMNREGVRIEDLPAFLLEIKKLRNIEIEGLMSHLASADNKSDKLNDLQIRNFKKALAICKSYHLNPKWIHISNSAGLFNNLNPGATNMARVGLALYGISHDPNLRPVLTLKSKIVQIKSLKKGDKIGYSGTFVAKKDTIIGILPTGYYDGIDKGLSNKGYVMIDGVACLIIGRVSMNITIIDLRRVKNPHIGQQVIVYSDNPNDKNSIENAAKLCGTIPYDILIHLAESTKRVMI